MRGLTAKEFRGWEMYYELEPFGEERADVRAASIVQMLYNVNRGSKQKAITLKECLLKWGEQDEPKKQQTWQEQLAIMKMLAAAYGQDAPSVPDVTEGIGPPGQPVAAVEETEDERVKRYMAEHMASSEK